MERYKQLFENIKNNLLDQAETHLINGNFNSAVRSIASSMGLNAIPHTCDSKLVTQEKNFRANSNNINNHAVLSNIQKILAGKGKVIGMKRDDRVYKQGTVNKMISKAIDDYDVKKQGELEQDDIEELPDENILDSGIENENEIIDDDDLEQNKIKDKEEQIMERYKKRFNESGGISIFDYVDDHNDAGYGLALMNRNGNVKDPYIDPSDYPDMIVEGGKMEPRVLSPGKYKGYYIQLHSGQLE